WLQCSGASCPKTSGNDEWTCNHTTAPTDLNCKARNVPESEASKIFEWMGTLELLGIPQIRVRYNYDHPDIMCKVSPSDQSVAGTLPAPDILASPVSIPEIYDAPNLKRYYSAIDKSNFNSGLKMIFSADSISCCQPAGAIVDKNADANICCTGTIKANGTFGVCALEDYTDVSLYFNRYVSSAAADLNKSVFDEYSGYIKDLGIVKQLACTLNVCASGKLATGVSLSNLKIPGKHSTSTQNVRRFISSDDAVTDNANGLATLWNWGLRWNNHVYCAPSNKADSSTDVSVTTCPASSTSGK
ncbi:MAG: hypothetical protein WCG27_07025, partial [Pseudomonadota bacterium]